MQQLFDYLIQDKLDVFIIEMQQYICIKLSFWLIAGGILRWKALVKGWKLSLLVYKVDFYVGKHLLRQMALDWKKNAANPYSPAPKQKTGHPISNILTYCGLLRLLRLKMRSINSSNSWTILHSLCLLIPLWLWNLNISFG